MKLSLSVPGVLFGLVETWRLRLCGTVAPGTGSLMFSRLCHRLGMPTYLVGLQ